jgi:hypothetical protein
MFDFSKVKIQPYPLGIPRCDSATKELRMEICNSCDDLNSFNFCTHCGCFMPLKTELANSSCPVGKWDQVLHIEK